MEVSFKSLLVSLKSRVIRSLRNELSVIMRELLLGHQIGSKKILKD